MSITAIQQIGTIRLTQKGSKSAGCNLDNTLSFSERGLLDILFEFWGESANVEQILALTGSDEEELYVVYQSLKMRGYVQ